MASPVQRCSFSGNVLSELTVLSRNDAHVNPSSEADEFRAALRSIEDDGHRFQACVAKRDHLLDRKTQLECSFACIEEVMVTECTQYKQEKGRWSSSERPEADAKRWEQFLGIANAGALLKKEYLAPLTKVGCYWGTDKVKHYGWASTELRFCKLLGNAASRSPEWEKALPKFNQLLLQKIKAGSWWRVCANSLEAADLQHFKDWQGQGNFEKGGRNGFCLSYVAVRESELPTGYAFDRYGLIVLDQFADRPEPADNSGTQCTTAQPTPSGHAASEETMFVATNLALRDAPAENTASSTFTSSGEQSGSADSTPLSSPGSTRPQSLVDLPDTLDCTPPAPLSPANSPQTAALLDEDGVSPQVSSRLRLAHGISYKEPTPRTGRARTSARKPPPRKSHWGAGSGLHSNRSCTCAHTVPSELFNLIGQQQADAGASIDTAVRYGAQQDLLCLKHLKLYAKWTTDLLHSRHSKDHTVISTPKRALLDSEAPLRPINTKRRRMSVPDARLSTVQCNEEVSSQDEPGFVFLPFAEDRSNERPLPDILGNDSFRRQVLVQLERKVTSMLPLTTWGELNDGVMHALLSRASHPISERGEGEKEVYYLTREEAERRLQPHTNLHGPIITKNQQHFEWDPHKGEPIEQLFRRMGNLNKSVSVQKPSLSLQSPSCTTMRLGDVQGALLGKSTEGETLNVLDLRNPLPRSILPHFLVGEDCQLLSRVRDVILEGATAERCIAPIAEWNKWRDDEDWVLLAQGGAQTLTHQDSCGKATWLTVQQGRVGFGWISRPTEEEKRTWSEDPNAFTGGNVRYVVLHPGQTVYFEAGTIHFVFRNSEDRTFMLGGHILRWSRVGSWMEILLNQLKCPNTTNEDLLPAAPAYVEAISQLIEEQRSLGRSADLGGEEAIAKFFDLKKASPLHAL